MDQDLVNELLEQFRRQWETIRDLLGKVPDEHWKAGECVHLVPARLLYHVLSGTEVYARSTSYEEYMSHRRFSHDWRVMPSEQLPDKGTAMREVDVMARQVVQWLNALGDDGLRAGDEGFSWTGSRKLGRAVYLLRHTQNHIGELNSELRRRGLPRGIWK